MDADLFSLRYYILSNKRGANVVIYFKSEKGNLFFNLNRGFIKFGLPIYRFHSLSL